VATIRDHPPLNWGRSRGERPRSPRPCGRLRAAWCGPGDDTEEGALAPEPRGSPRSSSQFFGVIRPCGRSSPLTLLPAMFARTSRTQSGHRSSAISGSGGIDRSAGLSSPLPVSASQRSQKYRRPYRRQLSARRDRGGADRPLLRSFSRRRRTASRGALRRERVVATSSRDFARVMSWSRSAAFELLQYEARVMAAAAEQVVV
jgi:hypothetical protein